MPDFYYANLHTLDTIKPRLFWLTLTTYAYKAIQALDRKMAENFSTVISVSLADVPASLLLFYTLFYRGPTLTAK